MHLYLRLITNYIYLFTLRVILSGKVLFHFIYISCVWTSALPTKHVFEQMKYVLCKIFLFGIIIKNILLQIVEHIGND